MNADKFTSNLFKGFGLAVFLLVVIFSSVQADGMYNTNRPNIQAYFPRPNACRTYNIGGYDATDGISCGQGQVTKLHGVDDPIVPTITVTNIPPTTQTPPVPVITQVPPTVIVTQIPPTSTPPVVVTDVPPTNTPPVVVTDTPDDKCNNGFGNGPDDDCKEHGNAQNQDNTGLHQDGKDMSDHIK